MANSQPPPDASELIQPADTPAIVRISWPPQPTVYDPRRYSEMAAAAMKVLAEGSTVLAAIKARRRL